jgi:Protein of unknown function (DUF3800)
MSASDRVWALVSGLPAAKRRGRGLMVLQAFIDDSGSEPTSPIFYLAGFVADHEQWAAFSDEWRAVLDESPKLDYFKMSEAASLRGQFATHLGWNDAKRDDRLVSFARVAARYARVRVGASIRHQDWAQIANLPAIERRLAVDTPYVMLAHRLILAVAIFGDRLGIHEPCDYIFDEQEGFSDELCRNWSDFKRQIDESKRSDIAKFIGSRPIFRDEKKFLPLQAADLYAWQVRRHFIDNHKVENQTIFIPPNRILKMFDHIPKIDREYSLSELTRLREHLVEIGEIFSLQNPSVELVPAAPDTKSARRARRRARKAKSASPAESSSEDGE